MTFSHGKLQVPKTRALHLINVCSIGELTYGQTPVIFRLITGSQLRAAMGSGKPLCYFLIINSSVVLGPCHETRQPVSSTTCLSSPFFTISPRVASDFRLTCSSAPLLAVDHASTPIQDISNEHERDLRACTLTTLAAVLRIRATDPRPIKTTLTSGVDSTLELTAASD